MTDPVAAARAEPAESRTGAAATAPTQAAALARRFEAVVFAWDGTAVPDRQADAGRLRTLVEQLCALGMDLVVVSDTHVEDVDGQLRARPNGPGGLFLCVNRGSEVYAADAAGLRLLHRRQASAEEEAALDRAAAEAVAALAARGLTAAVVAARGTRRRIALIPRRGGGDPPTARVAELVAAVEARLREAQLGGLQEVVEIARAAAARAGLEDARVTSDVKHVEIGLTDETDAAAWFLGELAARGIAPSLVLVAGDEFGPLGSLPGTDALLLVPEAPQLTAVSVGVEPTGVPAGVVALGGGPEQFLALLADQRERRRQGDLPDVDTDATWSLAIEGVDPIVERAHESLLTLADGRIGTRGSPAFAHPAAEPGVRALNAYVGEGPETDLAAGPAWTSLRGELPAEPPLRRRLDLRSGLLRQDGPAATVQFSSLAQPGTVVLRATAAPDRLPPRGTRTLKGPPLPFAVSDVRSETRVDRFGAYAADGRSARAAAAGARKAGFETLLAAHRHAWGGRWHAADVVVEGDARLQLAVRFALFHLMGSVPDEGEAAVGARGLSGPGYRGHVFWDSDVFVLPFLAATHPQSARAMLEYRIRRLPAAREIARRLGRAGARFPWESAADGFDVTPTHAHLPTGEVVRIRTGEAEEHIVADVAWGAACYIDWTGDEEFARGGGRDLLVETARYWASRARRGRDRRAHIYSVIGPDEYHEPVDDNAFTNVMARWNLRRAAALDVEPAERSAWLELADALVDGYDSVSGLYEQFAGFFDLEPLIIADIAPKRPIAADLLLGRERTRGAQVLKQADVLMLHHLVPDEVAPGSLQPNLDFYEPRTAHGSSLSPAVHAAVHARAGRFRDALRSLEIAARIDLDDLTGSTASGLHLATMGGLWQALAFGFAGIRAQGDRLRIEPHLPPEWGALEVALQFRGQPLRVRVDRSGVAITSSSLALQRHDDAWEVVFP